MIVSSPYPEPGISKSSVAINALVLLLTALQSETITLLNPNSSLSTSLSKLTFSEA